MCGRGAAHHKRLLLLELLEARLARLEEEGVLAVLLAHRRGEGAVARLGRLALCVEDAQDT